MEPSESLPPLKRTSQVLPLAVIGFSATDTAQLLQLLGAIPASTGFCFVCVQSAAEAISELLAQTGRLTLPLSVAAKGAALKPDHVYIVPAPAAMRVKDQQFEELWDDTYRSTPINRFIHALTEDYPSPPVGILMNGAAGQGMTGLKEIKLAGGLTIIEGKAETQGALTPEDGADVILSATEIAEELASVAKRNIDFYAAMKELPELSIPDRDPDLLGILHLLNKSVGVDFRFYKMSTIKRRIARRMMLHKIKGVEAYAQYLRQHTAEVNLLYHDLLINVTSFFRDPESLEYFKKKLLPEILARKEENDPVRIWVPACSTGQEAYTLAMVIVEVMGEKASSAPVQIFATDISEPTINRARIAVYSKEEVEGLSQKRLQRFFTRTDNGYRVIKLIRDLCVFATHNVTKDPPFSRLDAISCCNLMIYMDTVLQRKLLTTFHYSLLPDGYLIIGKSETASSATNLFVQVEKSIKIFSKKREVTARPSFGMHLGAPDQQQVSVTEKRSSLQKAVAPEMDLEKLMDRLLLSKYTPASVLVNSDLDILHVRGPVGIFLELTPGKASLNLLKMARPELGFELRNVVHKARSSGEATKNDGVQLMIDSKPFKTEIEAVPLNSAENEPSFVVIFRNTPLGNAAQPSQAGADSRVKQLEKELQALREDMRAIMESQEASNEELQSANEEIVSSNEELQSINEELETSKEELESSNEELTTINRELQLRNEQLSESQEYADAIFTTVGNCMLVLDQHLRVRKANETFYKTFNLVQEDTEGRVLFELGGHQWNIPALRSYLYDKVSQAQGPDEIEITHFFPGSGEKVLLFYATWVPRKLYQEGIVLLSIQNLTSHKLAQRMLQEREEWLRNMSNNAPVMIWVSGTDKLNTFVNKAYLDYRGITLEHAVGHLWTEFVHLEDLERCQKTYLSNFDQKQSYQLEYRLLRHDGVYRWILDFAKPNFTPEGQFTGFIGSCVDIHDQRMGKVELEKKVEDRTRALLEANEELERSHSELQQFAYVASHDLQEPLRKIITFIDQVAETDGGRLSEDSRRYFKKVHDTSKHMARLLDDLLNFSRISRLSKRFVRTDLKEIVRNVLSDLDEQILETRATITVDELPVIEAVPLQIAQLFHNLLHNALKFAKKEERPVVQVKCGNAAPKMLARHAALDTSLTYYQIVVADNGIGFSPQYAEQIFGIFQRLNDEETYRGTGIGLSLCRKIVTNHHGTIFAESEENKGAAFHIILPTRQPG